MLDDEHGMELVRGSGKIFHDLGDPDADVQQMKCILAAHLIGILEDGGLTNRAAQRKTGISAADFSRIRTADIGRFSIDHLVRLINKLDAGTEVAIRLTPRNQPGTGESERKSGAGVRL